MLVAFGSIISVVCLWSGLGSSSWRAGRGGVVVWVFSIYNTGCLAMFGLAVVDAISDNLTSIGMRVS